MNTNFYELLPSLEGEKREIAGGGLRCVVYKSTIERGFNRVDSLDGVPLFYSVTMFENYDRVNWNKMGFGIWLYFSPALKCHVLEYYMDDQCYSIYENDFEKMSRLSKGHAFLNRLRMDAKIRITMTGKDGLVVSEVILKLEKWLLTHGGLDKEFVEQIRKDINEYLSNSYFYTYIDDLISLTERGSLPKIKDDHTYRVMLNTVKGKVKESYIEEMNPLKCSGADLLEINNIKLSCERYLGRPAIKVSYNNAEKGRQSYFYEELVPNNKIELTMSRLDDALKKETNIFNQLKKEGSVGEVILKKAYEYYESIEPVEAVFGRKFKYANLIGTDYSETQIDFGNDSGFYISSYKYSGNKFYGLRPYNLPRDKNEYGVNLNKSSTFNSLTDLIIYIQLKFVGVVGYPVFNAVNVSQFYLSKMLSEPAELKFPFYIDIRAEQQIVKEALTHPSKDDNTTYPYTLSSYHVAMKNSLAREARESKNYIVYPEEKEALINLICSVNRYDEGTVKEWKKHINDNSIFEVEIYDRADILQVNIRRFDEGFVDNWVINHVIAEVIIENGKFKFYRPRRMILIGYDGGDLEWDTPLEDILFNDLQKKNVRSYYSQMDILESLCYKRAMKYDIASNRFKIDKEFTTQEEAIDYLKEKYNLGDIQPK